MGQNGLHYWTKHMIYPYTRKFVAFDDIKHALNGIVRMIEFRSFAAASDKPQDIMMGRRNNNQADPTIEGASSENWILSILEGDFKDGIPHGFCRKIDAFNGNCRIGYFKDAKAFGKYAEMNIISSEIEDVSKPGIYFGKDKCLEKKSFNDFLENETPKKIPAIVDRDKAIHNNYVRE